MKRLQLGQEKRLFRAVTAMGPEDDSSAESLRACRRDCLLLLARYWDFDRRTDDIVDASLWPVSDVLSGESGAGDEQRAAGVDGCNGPRNVNFL
jgi:hypothetical protein